MISRLYKRKDFQCKCGCGFAAVDIELVYVLEDLACHYCQTPVISGGCRCEKHNKNVGGVKGSYHVKGMAADFIVPEVDNNDVQKYLEYTYPEQYGIGRYNSFTHIDVRPNKARWDERSGK